MEQYNLNKAVLTTMGAVMNWGTKIPTILNTKTPKSEQNCHETECKQTVAIFKGLFATLQYTNYCKHRQQIGPLNACNSRPVNKI